MNLYIISSPLQMVCALESLLQLKSKSVFILILGRSEKANEFMLKLSKDYLDKEKVYYTKKTSSISLLLEKIKLLKKFNKKYHFKNIFIGNISEFSEKVFAINIKSKKLWSLDDGSKTLVLKDYYAIHNNKIDCFDKLNLNAVIKFVILKLFLLKSSKEIMINWFTVFNFIPKNGGIIQNHQLSEFKKEIKFNEHNRNDQSKDIYFIGTNLINVGVIKSEEIFFKLLSNIKKRYNNKKVYYIPHRFESAIHIERIAQIGFEIKEFNHIVEIAFLENNIYPKTIASFYSTALYTLSKIFPESKIDFYEIDESYLTSKFKLGTKTVEKEYKSIFGSIKY